MVRRTWGQYVAVCPRLQLTSHTQDVRPYVWLSATITEFNHVHRSSWYSDIFDRMHLFRSLLLRLHRYITLINGSVEGQYVTLTGIQYVFTWAVYDTRSILKCKVAGLNSIPNKIVQSTLVFTHLVRRIIKVNTISINSFRPVLVFESLSPFPMIIMVTLQSTFRRLNWFNIHNQP